MLFSVLCLYYKAYMGSALTVFKLSRCSCRGYCPYNNLRKWIRTKHFLNIISQKPNPLLTWTKHRGHFMNERAAYVSYRRYFRQMKRRQKRRHVHVGDVVQSASRLYTNKADLFMASDTGWHVLWWAWTMYRRCPVIGRRWGVRSGEAGGWVDYVGNVWRNRVNKVARPLLVELHSQTTLLLLFLFFLVLLIDVLHFVCTFRASAHRRSLCSTTTRSSAKSHPSVFVEIGEYQGNGGKILIFATLECQQYWIGQREGKGKGSRLVFLLWYRSYDCSKFKEQRKGQEKDTLFLLLLKLLL